MLHAITAASAAALRSFYGLWPRVEVYFAPHDSNDVVHRLLRIRACALDSLALFFQHTFCFCCKSLIW